MIILSIFTIFLVIWSNLVVLDELSRVQGVVIPSSKEKVIQSEFNGRLVEIKVKLGDKLKENFDKNDVEIIICVGYSNNNFDRKKVYNRIKNDGWQVGSLIPDCLEPKIFKYFI